MNINMGNSLYKRIFEDATLRVVMKTDESLFTVYNHAVMPPGALVQEVVDGVDVHNRYGQRFLTQSAAQKAFNSLKTAKSIVKLKKQELI